MDSNPLDLTHYFERIHYDASVDTTLDCLTGLHAAQRYSIPFENFDIQLGRSIDLAPERLIQKLVYSNRGGYCFELNGLFLMALRHIGFEARILLGRVHLTGKPTGRGHQITLVTLGDRQWIVDVGFGAETPRAPIPLEPGATIEWQNQKQRIIESEDYGYMLQVLKGDSWDNLYSFDLGHVCQGDLDYGNHYTSTGPDTIFVQARLAEMATPDGSRRLLNNTLTLEEAGSRETMEVAEGPEYMEMLEARFNIRLNCDFEAFKKLPSR